MICFKYMYKKNTYYSNIIKMVMISPVIYSKPDVTKRQSQGTKDIIIYLHGARRGREKRKRKEEEEKKGGRGEGRIWERCKMRDYLFFFF